MSPTIAFGFVSRGSESRGTAARRGAALLALVFAVNGAACGSSGKQDSGAAGAASARAGATSDGGAGTDGGGVGGAAGADGGGSDARTSFTLGGEAIGIVGTGLMVTSGTDTLALTQNGRFVFTMALSNGAAYSVTVASQPKNPGQSCYVLNGSGKIAGADIENVIVKCLPLHARYVLVADRSDNSVSIYAVVDPTGRLMFIGKAGAGAGAGSGRGRGTSAAAPMSPTPPTAPFRSTRSAPTGH